MRPRIFIGSSTKGLAIAEFAQTELRHDGEAELWTNSVFRSAYVPIENLMSAVEKYDFALFILLPEDPLLIKDLDTISVRDNVIFELGLFTGRLGRERNFFISPRDASKNQLHLPSDLSGITPSLYDPNVANPQASVGTALLEMKQSLRKFQNSPGAVIFDADKDSKPFIFEHRGQHDEWKDDKPIGQKGIGSLAFLPSGVLQVTRQNTLGRYEIELRPFGSKEPTVRRATGIERVFRVTFKAKVEGGAHEIRLVLRDTQRNQWLSDKTVNVSTVDWQDFETYLRAPPWADFLLRIDDRGVVNAPSSVFLSSLRVAEVG